ncbi:HAMP domain-containing histidine kinase [Clostridium estertheticum]|uniref:sensor histidine kinase n=1 Tax=Clostridium estertheticum TaxID=238834 RepID=UPI001CF5B2A0|nr:HAMP domain-containing sensor histidine kinase [Clostridium estertheticum]MCB2308311.1 HAMP domain-containing histidine kinase [Clostridium estertheticum]MCB2346494.1 HAMP domain-containing histidine kinase [Clostridium estertheticum]MCB2349462.1 HAMP domain-containing histidine kinase [Clostridium estertheticum]WAG46439.1 HAMP domain-containing histidine kinase [Clostridium estertheticum]
MNNNDKYNNILAIITFTKFTILLFILILIFNIPYNKTNYITRVQLNLAIFLIFLSLSYLLWWIIYFKNNLKKSKNLLVAEDILFIFILSLFVLLSGTYKSQYKYLFFFSIITTTISQGKRRGLILSYISSAIILSIDLTFVSNLVVNTYFENDLVLSVGFIIIAWILGEHVTFESNQVKLLEMELQMLKLKEDAKTNIELLNETKEHTKFITEFFCNISHELKTPLNVIFASLQMMNMYNESNEEKIIEKRRNYLQIMKKNSNRLIRLINNLLDITKLDSGFITLHIENGNIVYLIEDITMSIISIAESKGIEIIFDTNVEEKLMAFDGDKIERIILNLLSNALKFTDRGGKIYVTVLDKVDNVEISVRDTGVGIPDDKKEIIFGRFMQVDKTLKRNNEGTGIGLSLVKSFVELHEGKIILKSEPNIGSEFIIILPVKQVNNSLGANEIKKDITDRINIELSDIYTE